MSKIDPLYHPKRGLDDGARSVVSGRRIAIVATENPDGSPHIVPTWFLFEDERFLVSAQSTTRKARNVASRPRARLLVEHSLGWVSAWGPARLVFGAGVEVVSDRIIERYLTDEGRKHFKSASGIPDDCLIEITPQRWMSWDMMEGFRRMRGAGHSDDEILGWFLPLEH